MQKLSNAERETIITFDEEPGSKAIIFTYSRVWQRHMEGRLGLKPIMDNGHGGKEYEVDKKRIKPPRAPRVHRELSTEARAKLAERLRRAREKSILRSANTSAAIKSEGEK